MAINMPAIADPLKSEAYERERKKEEIREKADKQLKLYIENNPEVKGKAMVVAAYDVKTGKIKTVFAGPSEGKIHPELISRANAIGRHRFKRYFRTKHSRNLKE